MIVSMYDSHQLRPDARNFVISAIAFIPCDIYRRQRHTVWNKLATAMFANDPHESFITTRTHDDFSSYTATHTCDDYILCRGRTIWGRMIRAKNADRTYAQLSFAIVRDSTYWDADEQIIIRIWSVRKMAFVSYAVHLRQRYAHNSQRAHQRFNRVTINRFCTERLPCSFDAYTDFVIKISSFQIVAIITRLRASWLSSRDLCIPARIVMNRWRTMIV